ncbi:unnamed protein product [Urochloa humidicola]
MPTTMEQVPLDVLLEIVARTDDAATVVRCAAASRHLRRGILDPSFCHLLDLRAAAAGGPVMVVAASYKVADSGHHSSSDNDVVETTKRLRFDSGRLLRSRRPYTFKYPRFGLLVLWRWLGRMPPWERDAKTDELVVCNTFTGHVTTLPRHSGLWIGGFTEPQGIYRCALLNVDATGGGGGFELLVMDVNLRTRPFRSEDSEWGPLRQVYTAWQICEDYAPFALTCTAQAVVVGQTAHWLCIASPWIIPPLRRDRGRQYHLVILALEADEVYAKMIHLPTACLESIYGRVPEPAFRCPPETLMLAATTAAAGMTSLSLVAAEPRVISTWTLWPGEGDDGGTHWSRQVVINIDEIGKPLMTPDDSDEYAEIEFKGYAEMSDTVLFWMNTVGLVQLNLGTKEATVVWRQTKAKRVVEWACLHETDLVSLLQGMKAF